MDPLELEDVNIEAELEKAEQGGETPPESPPPEQAVSESSEPETPPAEAKEAEKGEKLPEKQEKHDNPAMALRLARKEAKELKEQLRRDKMEADQKLKELQDRVAAFEKPPAEKPTFESDPFNYLKNEVDETKQTAAKLAQQAEQASIESAIAQRLAASEQAFMQENKDYNDAAQHMIKVLTTNSELQGIDDPQARMNSAKRSIMEYTVAALRRGKAPAEFIYGLARNYGYTPKALKESKEKLQTISEGQTASSSLGSGGRGEAGKLTLDALANMDDDDFNAIIADDKKWSELSKFMH